MTLLDFRQNPFKNSHSQYNKSCLSIGVQPEYATGDVLLASCYRALRLVNRQESEIDLEQIDSLPGELTSEDGEFDMWKFLFEEALRSPERRGESRPLPQLTPLVPSLGAYSGVLGRRRSRWNPGRLAIYALASGVGPHKFPEVVRNFAATLDTSSDEDDQFAVFLDTRLSPLLGDQRNRVDDDWEAPFLNWTEVPYREETNLPLIPAEAFAQDLGQLLHLKRSLTRRQWCALVESLLRLGLSTHVLWVCRLNCHVWQSILEVLDGCNPPHKDDLGRTWWDKHLGFGAFLEGGQGSESYIRRHVESYAIARLGINLVLHGLDNAGSGWALDDQDGQPLPAATQISHMLNHVYDARRSLSEEPRSWAMSELGHILDDESSKISAKSGSPKNLKEFLDYTLRRRLSKNPSLSEHDQGYLLTKRSGSSNAPWVVRPGPVLLLALCYATCQSLPGAPITLARPGSAVFLLRCTVIHRRPSRR